MEKIKIKLVMLLTLVLTLLTSSACDSIDQLPTGEPIQDSVKRIYTITPLDGHGSLLEIEYEGHKYLVYKSYGVCMIHSESCPCFDEIDYE